MIEPQVRPLEADGTVSFYQEQKQILFSNTNHGNNGNHYGWDNPHNPHYSGNTLPLGDGINELIIMVIIYTCIKLSKRLSLNKDYTPPSSHGGGVLFNK